MVKSIQGAKQNTPRGLGIQENVEGLGLMLPGYTFRIGLPDAASYKLQANGTQT